jgi:hypothetical protein
MSEQTAIRAFQPPDMLRHELRTALLFQFMRAGYGNEECSKLADLAIGPVAKALELAYAAYKLHVEAINVQSPRFIVERDSTESAASSLPTTQ